MVTTFIEEIEGFNFIDIGSSAGLQGNWKAIEHKINLIGFDPNVQECERMSKLPHRYKSVKYLPYAIAGEKGTVKLNKTKSIYCYSLLDPNSPWLNRFSFRELFEVVGEENVEVLPLSSVAELKDFDVDVLKTDTQGLELPILSKAQHLLDKAFFVETETGFVENYVGETTYAQIDEFMRRNGYLMFDMNLNHRISRDNPLKVKPTGKEQIMWCEAVWLKDLIQLHTNNNLSITIERQKALKILVICALQGCYDFGYELAQLFASLQIITIEELAGLSANAGWQLQNQAEPVTIKAAVKPKTVSGSFINYALRLLPKKVRAEVKTQAEASLSQKHLLKF